MSVYLFSTMSCFATQVHEFDISTAILAVLRRDVLTFPIATDPMVYRSGQGAGVHVAEIVPSVGVGTAGARSALRSRGGDTRGFRAPAHRLLALRVSRASGPVLFRHLRDAHLPGQALGTGLQRRQLTGVAHVPHARLDRYILGRLPVRLAHRICKLYNTVNIT